MLLDIQGSNYSLFDPEIGTKDLLVNDEVLFRAGNILYAAMETFISNHEFNEFCEAIGLKRLLTQK